MVETQKWLGWYYPKEIREKVTELEINKGSDLTGELCLSDFVNLEYLT